MESKMLRYFLILLLLLLFLNCSKTVFVDSDHIIDNKYDSEFPNVPTSDYLEDINKSVMLVNVMVSYHVYDFLLEKGVTKKDLTEDKIEDLASARTYISSPASGTASIIYNYGYKIGLLSCAHIFNFPDTILINYYDENNDVLPYIQSAYFKVEQNIIVPGLPEMSGYEILASDVEKDIALIGKNYSDSKMMAETPLRYAKGKAKELKPGTFVFLFGYPRGIKMVSKAIVGQANKDSEHNFIIDAAVHNGISGGPVFALRDGPPNFEMVGMVFAIAGEMLQFLGPAKLDIYEPNKENKYEGDIYLRSTRQIVYGVTYAISMESIEQFLMKNFEVFKNKGYNSNLFFSQKNKLTNEPSE